ncbi:MAG TPA: UDP-N-acetylmuramate dehydrogenase [Candidatus Coprovivens excrementavium]|nr:UDP-N-acetylmuramate dehydrogenase [Candidatus Coprovivens excrementavium]
MINELKQYGSVEENGSLKNLNTYHIAGKAKYLVSPNSINDLIQIIKIIKENDLQYFILGNGSNIVLNDREYNGVIIRLNQLNGIEIHPQLNMAYAEAGAMLPKLVQEAVNNSLMGLEFAAGIPGTIGGSIYGNAGAYNSCILDYVTSVTVLDEDLNVKVIEHENITYSYRTSMFKEEKKYIILAAKFFLKEGDQSNSLNIIEDRRQRRIASQPLEYPSAGSVFRNPEGDFAGRLIESCDLKGYRIGGAEVSSKHANFIINVNNATGKDIYTLIKHVHDTVLEKTNVDLHIEQEFIDWE